MNELHEGSDDDDGLKEDEEDDDGDDEDNDDTEQFNKYLFLLFTPPGGLATLCVCVCVCVCVLCVCVINTRPVRAPPHLSPHH